MKKPSVYIKFESDFLYVWGKGTYKIKDSVLKPLGFKWDPNTKRWYMMIKEEEEAKKKVEELEKHAELHWVGKPLIKHESVVKNIIGKPAQDKEVPIAKELKPLEITLGSLLSKLNENGYIEITPDLKDVQAQIEREIQNWQKSYFFKYTTSEQGGDYVLYKNAQLYVLSDLANSYMYVIRDEKSLIESFLSNFDNFIMKGIASKVGALTVVNGSDAVRYCDIPRKAIEALEEELLEPVQYGFWTTFSFNDFKTELPVNWSRGCFYIKKDEISIALKEFMISNYKQLGALMIDEKGEIEFVSPAILTRLKSDKRFTELKLNTAFAKATLKEIEGKWQKKSYILGIFTMYISPDERYYALTDAEAGVVYILRDQEHMIADFMDGFEKFLMQDLKERLGAKEVAKEVNYIYYPNASEEMIKKVIELEQSDFSYTTNFKIGDFYGSVRVGYCPAVQTLCVTKSVLSENVRDFVYREYKKWWG